MGELLGLTWSCVDISQDSIDHDCAYIYIDKELQRISRESLAQIGEKGIMFKFPTMRGVQFHCTGPERAENQDKCAEGISAQGGSGNAGRAQKND